MFAQIVKGKPGTRPASIPVQVIEYVYPVAAVAEGINGALPAALEGVLK